MFYEIACRGRLKSNVAKDLLSQKVSDRAVVITDKHKAYIKSLDELDVKQHKSYDAKIDHAPLNPINSLHLRFKSFLHNFKGVATRRLGNYLAWFKWLEVYKNSEIGLKNLVIKQLSKTDYKHTWESLKHTPYLFMDYYKQTTNA